MIHALILLVAILVYSGSCFISYSDHLKQSAWYFPIAIILGAMGSTLWFYGCKLLNSKEDIFVFGLMWDVVLVGVFYGIPILAFGVRLDKWTSISAALILLGILSLKLRP